MGLWLVKMINLQFALIYKDRFNIVLELMNQAIGTAWNLGYEDFWFITKNKKMLEKCKSLGVKVSEEPYYLIQPKNSKKEI